MQETNLVTLSESSGRALKTSEASGSLPLKKMTTGDHKLRNLREPCGGIDQLFTEIDHVLVRTDSYMAS